MNLELNIKQQAALDWVVGNRNATREKGATEIDGGGYLMSLINDFVRQHAKARRDAVVANLEEADEAKQSTLVAKWEKDFE